MTINPMKTPMFGMATSDDCKRKLSNMRYARSPEGRYEQALRDLKDRFEELNQSAVKKPVTEVLDALNSLVNEYYHPDPDQSALAAPGVSNAFKLSKNQHIFKCASFADYVLDQAKTIARRFQPDVVEQALQKYGDKSRYPDALNPFLEEAFLARAEEGLTDEERKLMDSLDREYAIGRLAPRKPQEN